MMPDAYHELANVVEVKDASELTIPRAKALFGAVQRQRDYSLVQILRHPADGDPTLEEGLPIASSAATLSTSAAWRT